MRRLQRGLRRAGYAPGPADGRYGPRTTAAVKRFQANHRLRVTGVVGSATWRALRAHPVLALGAGEVSAHGSPAVARLQRLLSREGFSPGAVDGRFGPRTERAVIRFQRARRLAAHGIAGPTTMRALLGVGRASRRPAGARRGRRPLPTRSAPSGRIPVLERGGHPRPASSSGRHPRPAAAHRLLARPLPVTWILVCLGLALLATAIGTHVWARRHPRAAHPAWPSGSASLSGGHRR